MTAVPEWDLVDPRETDADLVSGCLAGDRAAFAQIYDRYADRLHDFCVGMLRDLDGAADCVQDTFIVAATRLHQLREPDKLRPWLYSIARNEALHRLRQLRRETPSDDLPDMQSEDAGPDALAARTELAELIAEAAGGLTDRDRAVFDLAFRHGLNGPDLADALGVSHSNANTMVVRLRRTVERSLGALLLCRRARNTSDGCAELREILAGWDEQFSVLMRKRVARHIESCSVCDDERRRLVSPAALLGATAIFVPAPKWLREKTLGDVQLTCHGSALDGGSVSHADDAAVHAAAGGGKPRRRLVLLAIVLIAVLGASAGLLLAWMNRPISITPTEASETVPASIGQTPAPTAPAQPPTPNVLPPVAPPVQTPVSEPTTEALPSSLPTAADPAPAPEVPEAEASSPPRVRPSSKPPMSFSPTVIVAPTAPPNSGSDGGTGSGAPPGSAP